MSDPDAVVIGAGPNGLVAANVLADAGWSVVVLEANDEPGGAVRTAEVTAPGFRNDLFSAFYSMVVASPVMRGLQLEQHGLRWSHAPRVLAHPRLVGSAAVLSRDIDVTMSSLDVVAAGDGERYRRLYAEWAKISEPFMELLLSPFPPVVASARLAATAGPRRLRDLTRIVLLPLRRFVEEEMRGEAGRLLFAGNALHADLTPETAGSALFGWMLVGLGQQHGFPVPVGGADRLTAAMVARAVSRGVTIECGTRVDRVEVRSARAVGVTTSSGDEVRARRAVLADCDVTRLLLGLVGEEHLSPSMVQRLGRVQRASGTFKGDWALSGPIPWSDPDAAAAGTVHIAESLDELTMTAAQLATGHVPSDPFVLVGQMTTADATRSPPGTESAWAYTHVPQEIRGDAGGGGVQGRWDERDTSAMTDRVERRIERLAPGFRDRIVARHAMSPRALEAADANLVNGDLNGGTAQLHQQLIFRPVPGLGRPTTPIGGLYLASASAHPGGAVHGACGANAARAALAHDRLRRPARSLARLVTGRDAGF